MPKEVAGTQCRSPLSSYSHCLPERDFFPTGAGGEGTIGGAVVSGAIVKRRRAAHHSMPHVCRRPKMEEVSQ